MAASSSSSNQRYDVFPSFSGEDVRKTFLSHLLMAFERRSINSFIDNEIERSRSIGPELFSAIKESRIAIVIFSKNYASSTWCLNELVEIHKCYKELNQKVIPIFHNVDPSEVRKQTGEFGKSFMKTCEGKIDDEIQRWSQALTDVANLAGEHLSNGPTEAHMVEKIANDVSNKLLPPSNGFGDFVGIEEHLEAIQSILCLESKEPRMIGIWGQSGIGKTTLGRALFSHLSTDFHFRNFTTYKCIDEDVYGMKLKWEKEFLSEILDQKDLKIENFGEVKKRLNSKKVLIILDDVVNPEFLKTLVGKTEWFGSGSRIIVITQDSHLLKAHKIEFLYEVKIPDEDIALKMLCQSAFGENSPPEGFKKLAVEVAKVAGNLPLGLSVLGSSLKGRTTEEWKELLPGLRKGLTGDIMKTLSVGYDRLDEKEQEIFLWIASLLNGMSVKCINNFFGDDKGGLKRLAEKSLIRITSKEKFDRSMDIPRNEEIVEMHNLLQKLGREIVHAESKGNPPGKRRFLTDAKEIVDVLTNQTGTETVLGISFDVSTLESHISIDKESFQGMSNLQFLHIYDYDDHDYGYSYNHDRLSLPNGLVYLPPKLKWIDWKDYPLKCLPSNFKAACLVELRMKHSKLEKLCEGIQQLGSLRTIILRNSKHLKEIPDLSKAIKLERVDFSECNKLESGLNYLPPNLKYLAWDNYPLKQLPFNFKAEFLVELKMEKNEFEKLWEGTQELGSLKIIIMTWSYYLKEIPNLSKATNLERVDFSYCEKLESFPSHLNWESLEYLNLLGCRSLKSFPKIEMISLPHGIEIEVDDCLWNKNLPGLDYLDCLRRCYPTKILPEHLVRLEITDSTMEKLCEGVQPLRSLQRMDLICENLKEIPDLSKATNLEELNLSDCMSLETLPFTIGNLQKLEKLETENCTRLKVLPVDVNLSSLESLNLNGCSSLESFPQISSSTQNLYLDDTAIEEVPCLTEMLPRLVKFSMCDCSRMATFPQLPHSIEELHLDNTPIQEVPCLTEMLPRLVKFSMCGCSSLTTFPQLSHSIEELHLDNTSIEEVPCLIEMLPRLIEFSMRSCSKLKSFPRLSSSIEKLYLDNTAVEEVSRGIEMFRRLTKLSMRGCSKLKNISPTIFRLTNLKQVDFTGCGGFITALSNATVMATIEDPYETIEKGNKVDKYFKFQNCLKLDRDARELIIQSSLKSTVILPGGEVPIYFKHRAYGISLTVTLPHRSLSHQFLRFNVCLVVKPLTHVYNQYLHFRYNDLYYKHKVFVDTAYMWKTDHLVLFSFKFQPTGLPSKLDSKDLEFKFASSGNQGVKEVGIRVLNVSTSMDDRDGRSSETDVVDTVRSNKQMQMTSFEENFNLPCDKIVTDTGLIVTNMWIDSMITEQQDAQIPILNPDPEPHRKRLLSSTSSAIASILEREASSASSASAESSESKAGAASSASAESSESKAGAASTSIFSCCGGLFPKKKKKKKEKKIC